MDTSPPDHQGAMDRPTRRLFLMGTAALMASGALISRPLPAIAQTADSMAIAELVTGKTIDPALAKRAVDAITVTQPDYPQALSRLASFAAEQGITDVETLKTADGFDGELKTTAKTLISALYLGYAGTPVAHTSDDGVQFVTYTQALTYRLTEPYTPIPSYSRQGTGYWAHLPEAG
ncbi:hypothetical protein HJ526_07360 [Donghicola sp. C2-DW-16]|uniref:Uncharacterized protein n=1 Tax=Donghicola mangrovi TaxID=2729614 RepID=A0ABX2PDG0_9RHOB|nr:hypothetical protein [Donghicola mangrovi]